MYNSRVKSRKTKKILLSIASILKFKTSNFSRDKQLGLIWVIIWVISLFLNWIHSPLITVNSGAFNWVTGVNWIIICLTLMFLIFVLFSTNKKEKFKLTTNISFKDSSLIVSLWLLIIILSLSSLYTINWLKIFSSEVFYWKWIIFSLISWILIIISWILTKWEYDKNQKIFLNDSEDNTSNEASKDNMKLPF